MDRLEKVLEDIKIAEVEPSEDLVRLTKLECKKEVRANVKDEAAISKRRNKITVRLLAAATFVAFIFAILVISTISNRNPIDGAAYYTIDINPSFGFMVDENNKVLDVTFQNEDAEKLYEGMDCIGLTLQDAIRLIVSKAEANGYIDKDDGTYVLLGQFLDDESLEDGEDKLNRLMASLETELGDGVKLIGVNGNKEDIDKAQELEVSPGLLILCELVDDIEADENVKVEDVVKHLPEKYSGEPEFKAPVIAGSVIDNKLVISWGEIDFSNVYAGGAEVEYKLLKGASLEEIKAMKNVVATRIVDIEEAQPTSFTVELDATELNSESWYCVYVHCSNTSKLSNVLPIATQLTEPEEDEEVEIEVTPEPIDEGDDSYASKINGGINSSGDKISLNWTGIDSDRFSGYKVMYSYTDSTPVYGEDGCYYLEYVTNPEKTSATYKLSSLKGYKEGRKFYFSITVLYDSQETKVAGNVISRTMPVKEPTVTEAPAEEYPSTNISGSLDGDKIYLNWGKISDERLEGYKVVYSFTDSTPEYSSSSYLRWITNASETSTVISLSELGESSDERVCYFSITALYNDHSVKRPGNAIAITIPAVETQNYTATTLNYATYNEDTGYVSLGWNAVDHPDFEGYKVVYSFTDSTPVYGDGCSYIAWITNASTTSCTAQASSLSGYEPGATGYFSITVLYNSHSVMKGGNVKTITFPQVTITEPTVAPTLSSAFCSEENGVVYMEWSPVSHELFEKYKVTCSVGGSTNTFDVGAATGFSKKASDLSGFSEGASCTFTVTAVYSNGDLKQSNSKTDVLCSPPAPEPTPTPALNSASCSSEGTVSVSWSGVSHADFEYYKVGYTINGSTTYVSVGDATSWSQSASALSGFEEGASCNLWVVAVFSNGDNNASGSSSVTLTAGAA